MAFPGAGARVFYNDAGEPIGWDYPYTDDPPDADDDDRDYYRDRAIDDDDDVDA
jgi:hypothetical protein